MTYDKGAKTTKWEKRQFPQQEYSMEKRLSLQEMVMGKLSIHIQKKE